MEAVRRKPEGKGAPLMGTLKDMSKEVSLHKAPLGNLEGVRLTVIL
jgi:hypothetical protein